MPAVRSSPRPDTLRLFVALWPDGGANAWLHDCDASIAWPDAAAREGPERRHLTLHFLGAVPRPRLDDVMQALQCPFTPFELVLGSIAAWPRGLLVAEPLARCEALFALHAALGAALQRAGQRVESRAFRPHVTLARRASGAVCPASPPPLRWPVAAYALVASADGHYRNLARYPAGVLSCAAADPAPATAQSPPARRPRPR